MAYHLLNKKQMNYGNRLDMPTSHNPKKDLYLSALADGALLDDEESPIAMSRAPAAVASPIEMPVVEYAPEAARALATAEKKKQVAIPNSGGATQDPLTGVVTLPEIFAEGAPRIPRTDMTDLPTAGCSIELQITRGFLPLIKNGRNTPEIAKLSDSVPEPVKMIRPAWRPSISKTSPKYFRASEIARADF
jgi:hypothetical protein